MDDKNVRRTNVVLHCGDLMYLVETIVLTLSQKEPHPALRES